MRWPLSPNEKKEEAIIEPSTPEGCTFRIVYGGLGGKIVRRRRRNIKQVRNGHFMKDSLIRIKVPLELK